MTTSRPRRDFRQKLAMYVQNARFGKGHRQSRGKEDLPVGLPGGTT